LGGPTKKERNILKGIISSRKCPLCGHHEVGLMTDGGDFYPLKPGVLVQTLEKPAIPQVSEYVPVIGKMEGEKSDRPSNREIWGPDDLRGDRALCMKYGVEVETLLMGTEMNLEVYRVSYLSKLEKLLEKEISNPIPVILDQYFAAPHLATGNPREVAEALWEELEEIRTPVILIGEWLQKRDSANLKKLLGPRSKGVQENRRIDDAQLRREFDGLTIQGFFELL